MNKETRLKIRSNVMEHLPKDTITFLFSGRGVRKSADVDYPFYANRNFLYVTGIKEPEAVVVLDTEKNQEILFIREIDEFKEKWLGHFMRPEEAAERSGIEDIRTFDQFEPYIQDVLKRDVKIGIDADHDTYHENIISSGVVFATLFSEDRLINIQNILVTCRMVKFPEEVEAIKKAIAVSDTAIREMITEIKPGNNENDMAARFHYVGYKHHGDVMFDTIIASGKNATTLHYVKNDEELKAGELVLCDLGIEVNDYGADISRTYPVSGTFTPRQKEIYEAVLNTFEVVKRAIRPGVSLLDLQELAKEKLAQACKELNLIKSVDEIDRYYYHSIGHSLGLDTHDVWLDKDSPLQVGNVITNEPGLYVAEEGIGVRIESDFLVTEDGCEDLGPQIPKTVAEIEALMR